MDADSIRRGLLALAVLALAAGTAGTSDAAGWVDRREVGPFLLRSDFPLGSVQGLIDELAQLQNDLVQALAIPPAGERIEIYLFQTESTYKQFLREHYPKVPYHRALYTKMGGVGRVFAYRSSQFEIDLRHESTHALLHAVLPTVPLWLDEGLAEYFEQPPAKRAYDNSHLFAVRWGARFGSAPDLTGLEKLTELRQMGASEYRASWAWVHFMLHGPAPARETLTGYVAELRTHVPAAPLHDRLAQRLSKPERQFTAHFKSWSR